MRDNNTNGKVDRALATFSEPLAAYSAGTAPWTLANVPSGGSLSTRHGLRRTATLTITEGAGAPDTAVGAFTIALAATTPPASATPPATILLRRHHPHRRRRPILVAGTLEMRDTRQRQGRPRLRHLLGDARRLHRHRAVDAHGHPSAGSLARSRRRRATATLVLTEGAGAPNTAVGSFRVVLAASATGIRDAAGNQASFASTAPADQATPVLVSLACRT